MKHKKHLKKRNNSPSPIVTTTAMKQRQNHKHIKKIGDVIVTIPCFGKSRSRSR
jgi:hypothetical protein